MLCDSCPQGKFQLLPPAPPYYLFPRGKLHTRGNVWSFNVGWHECCDPAGGVGALCNFVWPDAKKTQTITNTHTEAANASYGCNVAARIPRPSTPAMGATLQHVNSTSKWMDASRRRFLAACTALGIT